MYYQNHKTRRKYLAFPKPTECEFCKPHHYSQVVEESEHAVVIKNRLFYDQWEMSKVVDQLMAIPKRHVLSLSELQPAEQMEIMALLGKYEDLGYEVYARSPVNKTRSVPHQHTNLIKTNHHPAHGLLFWRRPYLFKLFK